MFPSFHLAFWVHRNLSLKCVIFFNKDWKRPYIVGFRASRLTDGLSAPTSRPYLPVKERYTHHPDRYKDERPTGVRFRMNHDIYSLGVLLLELKKGCHFGSDPKLMGKWEGKEGSSLRCAILKYVKKDPTVRDLGEAYDAPILQCLQDFEFTGEDKTCRPQVLRKFKESVLTPIEQVLSTSEGNELIN